MTKLRPAGSLKEAQALLVAANGGKSAHEHCRVSAPVVASYTDPDKAHINMPVDVVLDLERIARNPVVTRYLALAQDFLLVPMRGDQATPYPLALARITTETGQLLASSGVSVQDGTITVGEARVIKREAMEVAGALAALLHDVERVLEAA